MTSLTWLLVVLITGSGSCPQPESQAANRNRNTEKHAKLGSQAQNIPKPYVLLRTSEVSTTLRDVASPGPRVRVDLLGSELTRIVQ